MDIMSDQICVQLRIHLIPGELKCRITYIKLIIGGMSVSFTVTR